MCKYFKKCERFCKSKKSHFTHWEHIRIYAQKNYSNYLNYRTYIRLSKNAQNDILHSQSNNNKVVEKSNKINHTNLERYLVTNMIQKMIYDIVDKI